MMKKLIGLLLALMLLTAGLACAEAFPPVGEFVHLQDGDTLELWRETVTVNFTPGQGYCEAPYSLQVGDSRAASDCIGTCEAPELLAVQYDSGDLFFFIGGGAEDGMCVYHVYEYSQGELLRMPGEFAYCDGRGAGELLRATKYGSFFVETYDVTAIGAFTHEQEYVIAADGGTSGFDPYYCAIRAVPAGMYPFGRIVEITQDLPLLTSREDGAETVVLEEGTHAMIVASDGDSWACLCEVEDAEAYEEDVPELRRGWVKLAPGNYRCIVVNGQEEAAGMYIDGIVIGG